MPEIDPSLYVHAPMADVATAVALGVSLLSALPAGAPAPVKAAGKRLRASVVSLQTVWRGVPQGAPDLSRRAADTATDNAWGCLESRLASYSRLPADRYPKAERAAEIHSVLFESGLEFLTRPYKAQWAEGQKRLQLIDKNGYADDVAGLAGPEFLAEVRRAQGAYGKALGVTKAEELPPDANVLEPLREVGRRVVDLSLQLLAWSAADSKAEPAVRKALKPIDDLRAAARRSSGPEPAAEPADPAITPATPIPDVPA